MRHTSDKRGESFWDVFEILPGQINISKTKKGQRRGFHMHKRKTDYWFLVQGLQLVVLYDEKNDEFTREVMLPGQTIVIKPGLWHAYQALANSIMVYYETNKSGPERNDDFEKNLDDYQGWEIT